MFEQLQNDSSSYSFSGFYERKDQADVLEVNFDLVDHSLWIRNQ